MKQTIIFDLDGVIVHSEHLWTIYEPPYLRSLLGPNGDKQIGSTLGVSISQIFQKSVSLGYKGTKKEFYRGYEAIFEKLYLEADITVGIDSLIHRLHRKNFVLGLVSSSPMKVINVVLGRMKHSSAFRFVESVDDHPSLRPKPHPDGYLAAMKALSVTPNHTIIIEDSPKGVEAAREAGAFVICFTKYLTESPSPKAHAYANTLKDIERIIYTFANSALK